MKEIPLTRGMVALVDDADYEALAANKWYSGHVPGKNTCYARRDAGGRKSRVRLAMHRVILGAGPNDLVDHVNGNGLDNRRVNLRLASNAQNRANTPKRKLDASSRYKGVSWNKARGLWRADIRVGDRQRTLGYFASEEEAARVYDAEAQKAWGEFALCNF